MERGAIRREMLDLPPLSVTSDALAPSSVTSGKVSNTTFVSGDLATKFAAGANPERNRGVVMMNRLFFNTNTAAGTTVTIGADVYEFRAVTPPAGGTAGRVWVYNGGGGGVVADCRVNLVDAINGVVNAATVNRTSYTNVEVVVASNNIGNTRVEIFSSTTLGTLPLLPSGNAIATTATLTGMFDVWDDVTMYGGRAETAGAGSGSIGHVAVTVTADMMTLGSVQATFPFAPLTADVIDRARPHDEVVTIAGNDVSVTLTGGGSPNIQPADVIEFIAYGA